MAYDPIRLEVFKNLLSGIAEEMGVTLCRTAFSPNIKERKDFSCALFDGEGRMVAQAEHIPVHLGAMPMSVLHAIEHVDMAPGDGVLVNDPYGGGTHLPDITLVTPIFTGNDRKPSFFAANRAHHADVGGMTPGSMPLSTEVFQEGIRIPPVKIMEDGRIQQDLLRLILANVRTPREREGDLTAQVAANRTGERRIHEVIAKYGLPEVQRYCGELLSYSERMTRHVIGAIPKGVYRFADVMDDDGIKPGPVRIQVTLRVTDTDVEVDFSGTDAQVSGSVNANWAVTMSAVYYCIRTLAEQQFPFNHGCMVPVRITADEGTLVHCAFPSAVAGGNVETSQRIVDVVLGALSQAMPQRVAAACSGTMNNITIGGFDARKGEPFTYYETIAGGADTLLETVGRVTTWIYENVRYQRGNTSVNTNAADVLASMTGVCQDMAHLALAMLRAKGVPARYVSGLLTRQPGETHAWVEFLHPHQGWLPADPTRGVVAHTGTDYLKFAVGRDYSQVPPVSGTVTYQCKGAGQLTFVTAAVYFDRETVTVADALALLENYA